MTTEAIGRPTATEYPPQMQGYIDRYADPGEVSILDALEAQRVQFVRVVDNLDETRGTYRYAAGKWSVKEVLGHVIDSERVFGYRALAIARADASSLPGFSEDDYVSAAAFDQRTLLSLGAEFDHLRRSHLALFASFDATAWRRVGTANDNKVSVRAIAWAIAGHTDHHLSVLVDRYGLKP